MGFSELMETKDVWQQKPMHKSHLNVGSKEKHTEGHQWNNKHLHIDSKLGNIIVSMLHF